MDLGFHFFIQLNDFFCFCFRVLATQLSAELTKTLVMTDPYRIRSAAEVVQTDYSLPLGVQLLHVYIRATDKRTLVADSARLRSLSDPRAAANIPALNRRPSKGKEPVISAMKRDQSLLFTTVPEEDPEHTSPGSGCHVSPNGSVKTDSETVRPVEWTPRTDRPKQERPRSLSLRCTTAAPSVPTPVRANTTTVCIIKTIFNYMTVYRGDVLVEIY